MSILLDRSSELFYVHFQEGEAIKPLATTGFKMNAHTAQTLAPTAQAAPCASPSGITEESTSKALVAIMGRLSMLDMSTVVALVSFGTVVSDLRDAVEAVEALRYSRLSSVVTHVDDFIPAISVADASVSAVITALAAHHGAI